MSVDQNCSHAYNGSCVCRIKYDLDGRGDLDGVVLVGREQGFLLEKRSVGCGWGFLHDEGHVRYKYISGT